MIHMYVFIGCLSVVCDNTDGAAIIHSCTCCVQIRDLIGVDVYVLPAFIRCTYHKYKSRT